MTNYDNHYTYYTMRLGEGASDVDAWELAYEDCEAEEEEE